MPACALIPRSGYSQDIVDDIQQECSTHGTVLSVTVPRPGQADVSRAVGECTNMHALVL